MNCSIITWLAFAASISGNLLVNNQNKKGYFCWILSNIIWLTVELTSPAPVAARLVQLVLYTALSIQGYLKWAKAETTAKKETALAEAKAE